MIDISQNYAHPAMVTKPDLNRNEWAQGQYGHLLKSYVASEFYNFVDDGWETADPLVVHCTSSKQIFEIKLPVKGGSTFFTFLVTHVNVERNLVGVYYSDGTTGELTRDDFISIMDSQTQDFCWTCKLPGDESAGLYSCVQCNKPLHVACLSPGWQADANAAVARDQQVCCDCCRRLLSHRES